MLKKKSKFEFFDKVDEPQNINEIIEISNTYHDIKVNVHKIKKNIKRVKDKIINYYDNVLNKMCLFLLTSVYAALLLLSGLSYVDNYFNDSLYSQLESKKDDFMIDKLKFNMSVDDEKKLNNKIEEVSKEYNIKKDYINNYIMNEKYNYLFMTIVKSVSLFFLTIIFLNTSLRYVTNVRYKKDWDTC